MAFEIAETDADVADIFTEFSPREQPIRYVRRKLGTYDTVTGTAPMTETKHEINCLVLRERASVPRTPASADLAADWAQLNCYVRGTDLRALEPLSPEDEIEFLPDPRGLYLIGGDRWDRIDGAELYFIQETGTRHPRCSVADIHRTPEYTPALYKIVVEYPRGWHSTTEPES